MTETRPTVLWLPVYFTFTEDEIERLKCRRPESDAEWIALIGPERHRELKREFLRTFYAGCENEDN